MNNNQNITNKDFFYNANEGFVKGNLQKNIYDQYKNYIPKEPKVNNEQEALLLFIRKSDFAAHELNLYLDTHPEDQNALNLFNFYTKEYNKAVDKYQEKYGPLCINDDNLTKTPFKWVTGKWPWEGK